jgi:hypothetical protein
MEIESGLTSFVACLTLGTLRAIQVGALPPEVGIWTLGPPGFWEPLIGRAVPGDLIDVLRTCDELDALNELEPAAFDVLLHGFIERVEAILAGSSAEIWRARWTAG